MPKKLRKTKRSKTTNRRLIIAILIPIIVITSIFMIALAPFEIQGNDLIKNFSIDGFDGQTSSGASNDGKLVAEIGGYWNIVPEDIRIVRDYDLDGIRYFETEVIVTNKINFLTAVSLGDIADGFSIDKVSEDFNLGSWTHIDLYKPDWTFTRKMYWSHYDYPDIVSYNTQNNIFSGEYEFSFDIDDSPLPDFITEGEDFSYEKLYSHIAVDGITVRTNKIGNLDSSSPEFIYSVEKSPTENSEEEEAIPSNPTTRKLGYTWNPKPTLSTPIESTVMAQGIIPKSKGSSLNPTTRSGDRLWDPEEEEKSMTDCAFTYYIASISPKITQFHSTLTYEKQVVKSHQHYEIFVGEWPILDSNIKQTVQATRQVAFKITNRYIQSEIAVKFSIWSAFNITALKSNDPALQTPDAFDQEDIQNLIIDGDGEGTVDLYSYKNYATITMIIIILAIIALGVALFLYWRYRTSKKTTKGLLRMIRNK